MKEFKILKSKMSQFKDDFKKNISNIVKNTTALSASAIIIFSLTFTGCNLNKTYDLENMDFQNFETVTTTDTGDIPYIYIDDGKEFIQITNIDELDLEPNETLSTISVNIDGIQKIFYTKNSNLGKATKVFKKVESNLSIEHQKILKENLTSSGKFYNELKQANNYIYIDNISDGNFYVLVKEINSDTPKNIKAGDIQFKNQKIQEEYNKNPEAFLKKLAEQEGQDTNQNIEHSNNHLLLTYLMYNHLYSNHLLSKKFNMNHYSSHFSKNVNTAMTNSSATLFSKSSSKLVSSSIAQKLIVSHSHCS